MFQSRGGEGPAQIFNPLSAAAGSREAQKIKLRRFPLLYVMLYVTQLHLTGVGRLHPPVWVRRSPPHDLTSVCKALPLRRNSRFDLN